MAGTRGPRGRASGRSTAVHVSLGAVDAGQRQPEDPLDSFQLFTLNGAVRMGPGTTLLAEWARTDGNAREAGTAGRIELRHHSEHVDLQMFAVQSDSVYANPSSSFGGGRRELGATFAAGLTSGTRLLGHALRSEDRRTEATRDGALEAIEQRFGPARLELGYRYGRETAEPVGPTTAGATPNETNAAHARLTLDVGDTLATGLRRASLFAEYDQDVHDAERRRGAFGAQVQVLRRMRLYGRHEFLSSFAGPFALNGEQESQATVFGFDAGYADDGQVFSEYRLRDGLAGRDGEAVIGLRNRWTLARGLRLDASFERIHPTTGPATGLEEATAVTGALDFSTSPDWRATARLE